MMRASEVYQWMEKQGKAPYKPRWKLRAFGRIREFHSGCCPITWACWAKVGERPRTPIDFEPCARSIGLSLEVAVAVANAADDIGNPRRRAAMLRRVEG